MDRPLSGLVLDVSHLVRTFRKKLTLKQVVRNHLPSSIKGNGKKGGIDTADPEDVALFWNLMLDVIMETVEGPMRSELLQTQPFGPTKCGTFSKTQRGWIW